MPEPLLLSIHPEVANSLGVGRSTAYQLVDSGVLPSVTIGRRRLVPAEALRAYVDRLISEAA